MTDIIVFTDGASLGNPGPGGWGAVIVASNNTESKKHSFDKLRASKAGNTSVFELGGGEENTTNNRMELRAAIESLRFTQANLIKARQASSSYKLNKLIIYSDSAYLVNGITRWINGWVQNGWKTKAKKEVQNRDLWEELYRLTRRLQIEWRLISGHSGFPGNERADEIAVSHAEREKPGLFHGPLSEYDRDVLDFSYEKDVKKERERKKVHRRAQAYSYLTLVDGAVKRHKNWDEAKECIEGVSNAQYRKAISPEDEKNILAQWGFTLNDISE